MCIAGALAFGSTPSRVQVRAYRNVAGLEMKRKGKRVSIQDRGEYMKRKRILDSRNAAEAAGGGKI